LVTKSIGALFSFKATEDNFYSFFKKSDCNSNIQPASLVPLNRMKLIPCERGRIADYEAYYLNDLGTVGILYNNMHCNLFTARTDGGMIDYSSLTTSNFRETVNLSAQQLLDKKFKLNTK